MATETEVFQAYVHKHGLKDTAQREEVLAYLLKAGKHMSPEEIYMALRQRGHRLGRATVFRTLKLLEECGLAAHITSADGTRRFEAMHGRPHHDHMICVQCGDVLEFSSPAVERIQERIAREAGFKTLWHRHEVFGRCKSCENGPAVRA
ncbi:MAG: Fur family transcriptional regulator [Elusimicrobiota bacterium]